MLNPNPVIRIGIRYYPITLAGNIPNVDHALMNKGMSSASQSCQSNERSAQWTNGPQNTHKIIVSVIYSKGNM